MASVLVVGGGGREAALTRRLIRDGGCTVLAAPGNPGIARDGALCLPVAGADPDGIVAAAVEHGIDLVVVGSEPGLVDMLGAARVRAFGPSAAAARIEASKEYATEVMEAAGVPTADSTLARSRDQELSLLALCDGFRALAMAPARDFDGMGSFSPVPGAGDPHALAAAIHQPVVDELRRRGAPFHGILSAGVTMTADGPRVLELGCRFGDPETQSILPRLRSDLHELLDCAARPGGLDGVRLDWHDDAAVTVVLASGSPSTGAAISGIDAAAAGGVEILHAGTAEAAGGELVTAGGRVLNVTAVGPTLTEAGERAYAAADMIEFDGRQLRSDMAQAYTELEARSRA